MRAEHWQQAALDLEGWAVQLSSYAIGGHYLAEVEVISSRVTIARATEASRDGAEKRAIEKAAARLLSTRRVDFGLTVGG